MIKIKIKARISICALISYKSGEDVEVAEVVDEEGGETFCFWTRIVLNLMTIARSYMCIFSQQRRKGFAWWKWNAQFICKWSFFRWALAMVEGL